MELSGKALYNLLRGNWLEDPSLSVEPWQVEDYRNLSDQEIFDRLQDLQISLKLDTFLAYSQESDGPEELVELMTGSDHSSVEIEKIYLLLFELWRRKLPDRQTLSIFCDELDHLIDLFDKEKLSDFSTIETALEDLEKILDESVDAGLEPKDAFDLIGQFCAHDLESFVYDYISGIIDSGQELSASEWIDGFYDYIQESRWFDFLRAKVLCRAGAKECADALARLIEPLQEKLDLDLALEIATFLAHEGDDPALFKQVILICLNLIRTEEDFQDILAIVASYHRCLDQEQEEKAVEALFAQRKHLQLNLPFRRPDEDMTILINSLA